MILSLDCDILEIIADKLSAWDLVQLFRTCRRLNYWGMTFCTRRTGNYNPDLPVTYRNYLFYRYSLEILYASAHTPFLTWKDDPKDLFREYDQVFIFVLPIKPMIVNVQQYSDDYHICNQVRVVYQLIFEEDTVYSFFDIEMYITYREYSVLCRKLGRNCNIIDNQVVGPSRWNLYLCTCKFPIFYAELRRQGYVVMYGDTIPKSIIFDCKDKVYPCFDIQEERV